MTIIGPIAEVPNILLINAIPITAALLRKDACTKAPRRLLSFKKSLVPPHITQKHMLDAAAQNRTNFKSKSSRILTADKSRKSITGSVTLKLKRFAIVTKLSFNIPACFNAHPTTITRKIGNVTLILNKKLSILLLHSFIPVKIKFQIKIGLFLTVCRNHPVRILIQIRKIRIRIIGIANLSNVRHITLIQ